MSSQDAPRGGINEDLVRKKVRLLCAILHV